MRALGFLLLMLGASARLAGQAATPVRPVPAPTLTIGAEGRPEEEFVRIVMAVRTPSGTIAVVDQAAPEIRLFTPDGRFLRRLGRNGEGPGEFRRIGALFTVADTLVAFDPTVRRLTWYSVAGNLLRTAPFQYSPEAGQLYITARLGTGEWVVTTTASPSWEHGSGVYRDTTRVGILAGTARGSVRWIGTFPGTTFFVYAPAGRKTEWKVGVLPYSSWPIVESRGDSLLIGQLADTTIGYYSGRGRLLRTLALPRPPAIRSLSPARDEALASARTAADRNYIQLSYEAAAKAPGTRIWDDLVVADDGALWLAAADPRSASPRLHLVVAPDGRLRASWLLPPRSRLLSVRESELMVAARDADDVERVLVIRVSPSGAGGR